MTLTELRKINKLSCKEMAKKIEIPFNTYRNKEYGQINFKIEEVLKISNILNLSTDIIIKAILEGKDNGGQ